MEDSCEEGPCNTANSLVGEDGAPLLRTTMLTPDTALPNTLPDLVVATPARAVEDVLGMARSPTAELFGKCDLLGGIK